MVATAIIGGVASVAGAEVQSSAANKAAKAQTNAANQAIAAQQGFFDTSQQALQPFIDSGSAAAAKIGKLQGTDGGGPSDIQATLESLPGYQFANYQGLKSTQNSATERGLGLSGAALKGAATYSTGLANSYYNNLLEGLQNTESIGANSAGGLASAATQTGANVGSDIVGIGQAQAGSDLASGKAFSNIGTNTIPNSLIANKLFSQNQSSSPNATNFLAPDVSAGVFDQAAFANGLPWSDKKLKENIITLGMENNIPIYEFNYTWNPQRFIGVIAQEIMEIMPSAVRKIGNYLAVDYSKIGVRFRIA